MTSLDAAVDHLHEQARKAERKAERASSAGLREYYRGKADGLRAAATELHKFTVEKKTLTLPEKFRESDD